MAFRVMRQLYNAPSSSVSESVTWTDPPWAKRKVYIMSSSDMPVWEFEEESDANAKALELSGSDSMNRVYKVIEV